jgi:hypothetical protein
LCRAKGSQRFQQRYASMIYFYAVRFALQQAMQQQGGFANLLFFIDEMQNTFTNLKQRVYKLPPPPQGLKYFEVNVAVLACKKNHLIACEVALYFEVYARQSNNFFRHEPFTSASMHSHVCEHTRTYKRTQMHTHIHIHERQKIKGRPPPTLLFCKMKRIKQYIYNTKNGLL